MKLNKSAKELKKIDPILGEIINENIPDIESDGNVFESLLSAIISQQISLSAAKSIKQKFLSLFKNKFPSPEKLLEIENINLQNVGLSKQKISYLKNVALHFKNENLKNKDFQNMSDREVVEDLVKKKV